MMPLFSPSCLSYPVDVYAPLSYLVAVTDKYLIIVKGERPALA
jgi:hypothetical protein